MIHKRITKITFDSLLEKTRKRMSSWKRKMLNMATVLIKVVLTAMPSYFMQTFLIPNNVLCEIEKLSRGGRKIHMVAWEEVLKAKGRWFGNSRS